MDVRDQQRITIDSLSDWQQTKEDFTLAAKSKLEARLGSVKNGKQRDAILVHLNRFVEQTLTLAQPNLRVNGRNFEDVDENEELEQFDEALDRKIWALADSRLALHKDISATRRNVPKELEHSLVQLFDQQKALQISTEEPEEPVQLETTDVLQERYSQIEDSYRKTVALSEELTQVISHQQERTERFEVVSAEIKSLPP